MRSFKWVPFVVHEKNHLGCLMIRPREIILSSPLPLDSFMDYGNSIRAQSFLTKEEEGQK